MDTHEVWKKSPLAPDHVEVSNHGRVRTLDRKAPVLLGERMGGSQLREGRIMSLWIGKNGYHLVQFKIGQVRPKFLVHRLVASAFCEGFDAALSVNHINCNKLDNRPENLEWISLAKNTELQWRDGLVNLRGENHPSHKLSLHQVRAIRKLIAAGATCNSIAVISGVSPGLIYKIRDGKRWAHSI